MKEAIQKDEKYCDLPFSLSEEAKPESVLNLIRGELKSPVACIEAVNRHIQEMQSEFKALSVKVVNDNRYTLVDKLIEILDTVDNDKSYLSRILDDPRIAENKSIMEVLFWVQELLEKYVRIVLDNIEKMGFDVIHPCLREKFSASIHKALGVRSTFHESDDGLIFSGVRRGITYKEPESGDVRVKRPAEVIVFKFRKEDQNGHENSGN